MSFVVPRIYQSLLRNDPLNVVMLGGISLLVAACAVLLVRDIGYEKTLKKIAPAAV
jgi:hypothetical protein